jgi:SNF2 family DNA or RNA helicase
VEKSYSQLSKAVRALALACDGAQTEDGIGFSRADSRIGTQLALIPDSLWTPSIAYSAWLMLAKYSKQLKTHGIIYDDIETPKRASNDPLDEIKELIGNPVQRKITKVDNYFVVRSEYDEQVTGEIKQIPGAVWNTAGNVWFVQESAKIKLAELASKYNFSVSDEALTQLPEADMIETEKSVTLDKRGLAVIKFPYSESAVVDIKAIPNRRWDVKKKYWLAPLSISVLEFADKYELDISPQLRKNILDLTKKSAELLEQSASTDADIEVPTLNGKLMPYQRAAVAYVSKVGRCLIADQMGLGKTVEAIASLEHRNAFPAVIVCPASLKENWKREFNKWLPHRTVNIVSGKTDITSADINIVNYDIVGRFVEPILHLHLMGLVLDESHYIKTSKTKRTLAVRDIAKSVPQSGTVLLLSGTPVTNRPEELVSQLEVMGMIGRFGGKWAFLKRYTDAKHNGFGWDTKGASNLGELNLKLRQNCYMRRTKDEVLTELPAKTRNVVHIEPSGDGWKEYKKAEKDLIAFLSENGYKTSDSAEHLRRTTILKRLAADAKMESVLEWIDSFLESCDRKLIVFAHNVDVVDKLSARYGNLRVSGRDSMEDRQRAVDSFQNDKKSRVIVLNIQAGGVGLTLTAASDVCFVQQGWTPGEHDQAEDRAHRLGQKNSVQAWYLIGANTIDEDIYDLIEAKRSIVDAVTEGDEVQQQSIISDLMKRFYGKIKP